MSFQSLVHFPEELSPVADPVRGLTNEHRAQFPGQYVELRSELGALYLRPSRWERLRLLWTFRHFHVLPTQILSRADQRLIERLSQSALAAPPVPFPDNAILGVVEEPKRRPMQVVPWPPAAKTYAATLTPVRTAAVSVDTAAARKSPNLRDAPFPQWKALGALMCVCLVVLALRVYRDSAASNLAPVKKTVAFSSLSGPTAVGLRLAAMSSFRGETTRPRLTVLVPSPVGFARPSVVHATPAPTEPALPPGVTPFAPATVSAGDPQPMVLSELPQGHLVKPVVSDPNLVGSLRLRALIGPDGSVKDVTVLSGNPKLAEAGLRAVRLWHYSQYAAQRHPGDAQALIGISFFGPDAISISSLAK